MQGMAQNVVASTVSRTSNIDVPVRILVPSESVGAIIGKGGQTIRQLTQQTRAKVDVFRGDPLTPSNPLQEKVITIRGQPENCINACKEILKVMKADAESKGKPSDIPLKVLAHNDYIGRIIGKQGNIINTIKKDTDTTVTVSSINDLSINVERVITVKGELDNMISALEIIHQKIKQAFENDTKTYGTQAALMMGGMPPMSIAPQAFAFTPQSAAAVAASARFQGQANAGNIAYPPFFPPIFPSFYTAQNMLPPQAHHQAPPHQQQQQHMQQTHQQQQQSAQAPQQQPQAQPQQPPQGQQQPPQGQQQQPPQSPQAQQNELQQSDLETVYLYIPSAAVGAIIGTKGSFIKNMIKMTGASVKITPLTPEEAKNATERQVVITGTLDSQWKAQYYIYEKIRQDRLTNDENVKLKAEIHVPAQVVGRIIGKSGKNVRELQRTTNATIKLPEDANTVQTTNPVVVRIFGTFNSSQCAQRRIQSIVMQSVRGPSAQRNNVQNQNIMSSSGLQIQSFMTNPMRTQNGSYRNNNNKTRNNNNNNNANNQQAQAQQNESISSTASNDNQQPPQSQSQSVSPTAAQQQQPQQPTTPTTQQ